MTSRLVEVEALRGDFPSSAEERQGLKGSEAPRIEPQLLQGRRTWGYNPPGNPMPAGRSRNPEMSGKWSLKWKQHIQLNGKQYAGDHKYVTSRNHRIFGIDWSFNSFTWKNIASALVVGNLSLTKPSSLQRFLNHLCLLEKSTNG
jgi:hypothetical protein